MCNKPGCMYPRLEQGQPMPVCTCARDGNASMCPWHTQADFDAPDGYDAICADPPRTPTGVKLFTDVDPLDMWESNGVTQEDVRAVEREAAQKMRDALDWTLATYEEAMRPLGCPCSDGVRCPMHEALR